WQYSLNGGTSWLTIDANLINSSTNELALLLGPTAQLRLIPFGDVSGSVSDGITFRAWDQTSGSEGQYAVISSTGSTIAFSAANDTASITVTAINDAPTFLSGDGIVTTAIGTSQDYAWSVTVQPDGKVLLGGSAVIGSMEDFALVRYNADGSLDSSFGTGGKVTTAVGTSSDQGYSVTLQPDGKIVVGGYSSFGGNWDFALVRYNANGTLDTSFGTGGMVSTAIGTSNDQGRSVTIQRDGKIVVGGYASIGSNNDFALVRYNANGTLDTSFGSGGMVTTAFGTDTDVGYSVTIQPDGKIVVGGYTMMSLIGDFALVRYNANGTLDTSFGTGGMVTTAIGTGSDIGMSVTIQPDGKFVVSGYARIGSTDDFALVRYNPDGSLDTTFGTGGRVTTAIDIGNDRGYSVTVQADGKIVVGGSAVIGSANDFALVRYNADGSLDTTFDLASTLGGTVSYTENGSAVVLDSNVRIFDAELSAASNFSGATLTLARNGGANGQDLFSATGTLGALTQGSNLVVGGTPLGSVTTNRSGTLVLTINSSATGALVNSAMQQIAYANSSEAPPASVQIDWTFNDNNGTAQGTGGALTATGNVVVNITSVNDAPTITGGYTHSLTGTNEDTTSSGTLASALLAGASWADVDTGAISGLAITATTGNGTWQYSTDGTTWANFGAVSGTNALLITSTSQVRYIPNGVSGETATFSYKAWDQSSGTASTNATPSYATTASSGGTAAFSTNNASAQIIVSSLNDAPVLNANASPTLGIVLEGATNPSGVTVAAMIVDGSITDPDGTAVEAIAITGLNTSLGTWQYSLNGGTSWLTIDANLINSSTNELALLLGPTAQLRLIPFG
ncbi:MAG: beta strand repeat-containing protein, partial [Pirellula sp.]